MIKYIVFFLALGAVIAGVIYTLLRDARRRRQREQEEQVSAERDVAKAAVERLVEHQAERQKKPEEGFDPASTRLHFRPEIAEHAHMAQSHASGPLVGTPKLVCLSGRHKGHVFTITPKGLTIGRAEDNDVVIVDPRVSSHHAWVGVFGGRALLRDYESLNGTFVNADMDAPVGEVNLAPGDTIFFGGHGGDQYRFVVE